MADTQDFDKLNEGSATPEPRDKEKSGKKKKKKKRGCGFFILMLLLVSGVAAGIQASGGMDFRPMLYPLIPRVPKVGPQLASFLNIPPEYSLTVEERRRLELEEWERELAQTARSLDVRQSELEALSQDLSAREGELDGAREELAARLEALSNDMTVSRGGAMSATQREEIEDIVRTFEEMSPKNAAAILEKLNPNLAVSVLDGLPEDFRAKALGRMEAAAAAGLMEQLTELQRSRGN